ncbi:MAG: hypothetical protein Q8Q40_06700 [Methylococcaceae bacterium]|nr:hypothetical protein [Methylococcaceae bacterium]MDP3903648.1 hypothetical protein [Methylococcaceae bacterium]
MPANACHQVDQCHSTYNLQQSSPALMFDSEQTTPDLIATIKMSLPLVERTFTSPNL